MTTNIHHLLDTYFEGATSAEEEKMLRRYFTQDDLPGDLQEFAPIFRFLEDESEALAALNEIRRESNPSARHKTPFRKVWTIAAVAASLLIAVVLLTRPDKQSSSVNGSYVWVDGKRISDPAIVRKYAESSFGKIQPESDILEDQLRFILE